MGFGSILTIAFIILKLCGIIAWSWLWILSPLWIEIIIDIVVIATFIMVSVKKLR